MNSDQDTRRGDPVGDDKEFAQTVKFVEEAVL